MGFTKDSATERARKDLSSRLGIGEGEIRTSGVSDSDFPDMSLGAGVSGEMSAQMITSGWKIDLEAGGRRYEYRADSDQLRLVGFNGRNHVVE